MALTPTDPTKAQIWIRGTAPDQIIDLYVPRGAKGDPGGIVLGTLLGTADLNAIRTSGVYRQTAGANATALNNYPRIGNGGVLMVQEMATDYLIQTYEALTGLTTGPTVFYKRALNGTTWTPWRQYNSTRVDQTAGRAIYQWDETNSREQLVWGDTGWRSLTPANGWTASSVMVRRVGSMISLHGSNMNGSSATTDAVSDVLPVGFRSTIVTSSLRHPITTNAALDTTRVAFVDISTQALRVIGAAYSGMTAGNVFIQYPTTDPWPTTLPGTASGTIPNT